MRKAGMILWFVVLGATLGLGLRAQQSSSEKPARAPAMQAPQPGPEMQRLNFLLGD
jgi:predicted secreted protein